MHKYHKYIVKNKYTYEKRRNHDYTYKPDVWTTSQNLIQGRFIVKHGEESLNFTVNKKCGHTFDLSKDCRFEKVSGFGLKYSCDCKIKLTFFDGDGKSFMTVAEKSGNYSLLHMNFSPTVLSIECDSENNVEVTVTTCLVLDTLGRYDNQSEFYTCSGGSIKNDNGAIVFDFEQKGTLTSPDFPDTLQTVYNMVMPRRNTVFAVIANSGDVKNVTLEYTTYEHTEYSSKAAVTLELVGDGELHGYYFNLSNTENCSGRLKSLRFVFEGSGEIKLFRYSFEEEKKISEKIGTVDSCVADREKDSFKVDISIDSECVCGEVCIYATTPADEADTPNGKTLLGKAKADKHVTVDSLPLSDGIITYLPYQLCAFLECDGCEPKMIGERFYIENYRDFASNPYAFEVSGAEYKVDDFGAYGDGFHDDTEAIQNAVDAAAENGGGRVVLSGDDSFYGKRYVVTNILLRSNIEFVIEKNAVLIQNQIEEQYPYVPALGHDGVIENVNWTHNHLISNLPLIQCANQKNVKICGGGRIRMTDTGSVEGVAMPGYATGCADRIHLIPIGFFDVENVNICDIEIVRANCYHVSVKKCKNVSFENVKIHEVKCVSGDGFNLGNGANNVFINRCVFQSNDDAVILSACKSDPREILWNCNTEDEYNATHDVLILNSYLNSGGGKAICFITWGTNEKYQENVEIKNIEAYGNYLCCVNPVGAWFDNPYNGKFPFDNTETDDYSPVKHVRIFNNRYIGNCTIGPIQATDFLSDCSIHSTSNFRNGDFSLGGFANWTVRKNSDGESACTAFYASKEKGYITAFDKGEVSVSQGLYLNGGKYTFKCELFTGKNGACLFAKSITDGRIIFKKTFVCLYPQSVSADFEIFADAEDVYVGVMSVDGENDDFAMFDECEIVSHTCEQERIENEKKSFLNKVNEKFDVDGDFRVDFENGKYYLGVDSHTHKRLISRDEYEDFTVEASFRFNECYDSLNRGIGYGFVGENGCRTELKFMHSKQALLLTRQNTDGAEVIYKKEPFFFTSLDFHSFKLVCKNGCLTLWIDGSLLDTVKVNTEKGNVYMIFDCGDYSVFEPNIY